jgi:hypothetical protein
VGNCTVAAPKRGGRADNMQRAGENGLAPCLPIGSGVHHPISNNTVAVAAYARLAFCIRRTATKTFHTWCSGISVYCVHNQSKPLMGELSVWPNLQTRWPRDLVAMHNARSSPSSCSRKRVGEGSAPGLRKCASKGPATSGGTARHTASKRSWCTSLEPPRRWLTKRRH